MLNSSDIRGYTDTIILAQLFCGRRQLRLRHQQNVQEITRGELQLKATLYTTFKAAGNGRHALNPIGATKNAGARRRYYHLTEKGEERLRKTRADWRKYRAVISNCLEWRTHQNDEQSRFEE